MTISEFHFKKLGKMIDDPDYDLNDRFAPTLLDADFITVKRESSRQGGFMMSFSFYVPTDLGIEAYNKWKKENK